MRALKTIRNAMRRASKPCDYYASDACRFVGNKARVCRAPVPCKAKPCVAGSASVVFKPAVMRCLGMRQCLADITKPGVSCVGNKWRAPVPCKAMRAWLALRVFIRPARKFSFVPALLTTRKAMRISQKPCVRCRASYGGV